MLTVHVRINDAATGKPTPARVRFLDPAGNTHAPFGRLVEFATGPGEDVGGNVRLGLASFACIDGACEVRLPAGKVVVEVHKGVEYPPLRREVTLGPGQISLRLAVERWVDLRREGWYAGDMRAHELSPHAALLEGAAEDLAFVHLLARERAAAGRPAAISNLLAFSGTKAALEGMGCAVAVNTLNSHPVLGTVALLNCHRPVFPLRSGDPGEDDWSVADWCDQCHRKSGLVVWPDLPRLTPEHPQGEALAALLLGKVDAFEVSSFPEVEPPVLADWYRLLDCGCRLPLAGASGKDSNAVALGGVRTYARMAAGEAPVLGPWVEAVRAGRTFITNGPLLSLTVDGEGPGTILAMPSGKVVRVRAEARSAVPFDQLEVLAGGTVIVAKTASGNRLSAVVETEMAATSSTWMAARCWSHERLPDGQCVYAHTSPVYLDVDGQRRRPDAATAGALVEVLERTREWIARAARCPTEHHREHLAGIVEAGRQELLRRQALGPGG
jgi:hypothetical protein